MLKGTCLLQVVTAGPPPRGASRTSWELLSSGDITHILEETTPQRDRLGSLNTKISSYPSNHPTAESHQHGVRAHCEGLEGLHTQGGPESRDLASNPTARTDPREALTPAPANSPWDWRARRPGAREASIQRGTVATTCLRPAATGSLPGPPKGARGTELRENTGGNDRKAIGKHTRESQASVSGAHLCVEMNPAIWKDQVHVHDMRKLTWGFLQLWWDVSDMQF